MTCLILAAGKGSRLRRSGDCKPLVSILGVPLIERVIHTAASAGADEFYVVTGHLGDRVGHFLAALSRRIAIPITPLVNRDWEKDNGLSVLRAREVLHEPFLLLMADHLFEAALARAVTTATLGTQAIVLAVDRDMQNPFVDMEDVTRVKVEAGKICKIGKGLVDFNAFDTGIFYCTPELFEALEQTCRKGDTTLSGAVQVLGAEGRAGAVSVSGFWIDVDDPAAYRLAEMALRDRSGERSPNELVSR